jgi:hypothetical protein
VFNIDYFTAVLGKKSDPVSGGVNGDPVSECVRAGGSQGGRDFNLDDTADPFQQLDHLAAFQFELVMVGDMLVIAASALAKIRADWVNSVRRAPGDSAKSGSNEVFPMLNDFGLDPFPFDCQRDENDLSVEPPDAGSAKSDVMNV